MVTKEELPECLVATTVQLIGSKWKLLRAYPGMRRAQIAQSDLSSDGVKILRAG